MRTKLFALYAAAALTLAAVGPGIAAVGAAEAGNAPLDVSVAQADDGGVTVSVTRNGSGAANASVVVDAQGGTYAGEGEYATDDAGAVELPAPLEPVTVDVTASVDNLTATTTADLAAASVTENGTFGQRMSAFVHAMQEVNDSPIGPYVAAFAVENNPGNAPDHAGPPAFLFGEGEDRGPPGPGEDDETDDNETDGEDGNETDDERGPPEHAGPPDDEERGPPEHAGPPGDGERDEDDEAEEADDAGEEEDEDEDETDDEGDNGDRGPPEHAGPPE